MREVKDDPKSSLSYNSVRLRFVLSLAFQRGNLLSLVENGMMLGM